MSQIELDALALEMKSFENFELRQFRYDESALQLQWVQGEQQVWLTLSMKPGNPYVFFSRQRIFLVKNLKKPFGLFLKTHFIDSCFKNIQRLEDLGRVLKMQFEKEGEVLDLDFYLVPGRVNIVATAHGKSVSVKKPKDLDSNSKPQASQSEEVRNNQFFQDFWQYKFQPQKTAEKKVDQKELKKKLSGLKKMQEKLAVLEQDKWRELGAHLNQSQSLEDLPDGLESMVDRSLTVFENIEEAYTQSKKNKEKMAGTLERIKVLKSEIADLESGEKKPSKKPQQDSLFSTAQAKGKTLSLPEGRVFIGKSGPENLKLLRRAKPWYLWFHIKDYPGAYGIFEKNKNQSISEVSLKAASLAVIRQSLPKGSRGRFEVIYAECRYVRPIKGAKSGQVTYSHEKVLPIKVEE